MFYKKTNLLILPILLCTFFLTNCGYNKIQEADENVKASWAQVLNVYKRRFDLIPNLVNIVKGYASHEKDVLTTVTEARSRVGSIQATPALLNNPQAFAKFQAAQGAMTSTLSRLMLVVERYPDLKADKVFINLQSQIEGTENRIAVERRRFIGAVRNYNVLIRRFPSNLTARMFGYSTKPTFTVENEKEVSKPPTVKFGK